MFLDGNFDNAQLRILDLFQQCNRALYIAGQMLPAYFPQLTTGFVIPEELTDGDSNGN
jgi:hypothetical protein